MGDIVRMRRAIVSAGPALVALAVLLFAYSHFFLLDAVPRNAISSSMVKRRRSPDPMPSMRLSWKMSSWNVIYALMRTGICSRGYAMDEVAPAL